MSNWRPWNRSETIVYFVVVVTCGGLGSVLVRVWFPTWWPATQSLVGCLVGTTIGIFIAVTVVHLIRRRRGVFDKEKP